MDPSVFGLSATPSAVGLGASPPGIAGSPLAFGQPSHLGGGPTFGMSSPPVAAFGGASGGGFNMTSSVGGFGQGFGSVAAGASPFGSPSFGALAQAPAQSGFGSFSSPPPAAQATPFGSPFGAPRR